MMIGVLVWLPTLAVSSPTDGGTKLLARIPMPAADRSP
jgi:hypothetical protein